jgi:hypothetical protein
MGKVKALWMAQQEEEEERVSLDNTLNSLLRSYKSSLLEYKNSVDSGMTHTVINGRRLATRNQMTMIEYAITGVELEIEKLRLEDLLTRN